MTRLLCALCKRFEGTVLVRFFDEIDSGELRIWWEKHKKIDTRRESKEALRASALSKLTQAERKALGIK